MTRSSEKNRPYGKTFSVAFRTLSLLFILFTLACSKPAGEIGAIVQPEDTKLKVFWTDTAEVYAYSKTYDTVRTGGLNTTLLGSLMDPTFGLTVTSFYTQVMLDRAGYRFGDNPILDSLVLQLRYNGDSYGDTTSMLTVHVHQMLENFQTDTTFYSDIDIPYDPFDYANFTFRPHPHDSVAIGEDTIAPVLRINLSNMSPALGNFLLTTDTTIMDSNDVFIEHFKGLYVTAEPVTEDGVLVYFNLLSSLSEMIIYYHNDEDDSLSFIYPITNVTKYASKYEHDYSLGTPEFVAQIIDGDTALGSNRFYTSGLAGIATIIKIPNMHSWSNLGTIALNEAKLVLPGNSEDTILPPPNYLSLAEITDDGSFAYLPDDHDLAYFGGYYNPDFNSYTFRITQYLQSLISDPTKTHNGLYLITRGASLYPNRFVFNGNDPLTDTIKLHLEITFTDLD
jgi:hypothetical protein